MDTARSGSRAVSRGVHRLVHHRREAQTATRTRSQAYWRAGALVKDARHRQREQRDRRVESVAILGNHLISPAHGADGGFEMRTAGILEAFTGLEHRLLSDHAESLHFDHL